MPRAFAVFPVVSEIVKSSEISNVELCCQLSDEVKNTQVAKERQVPPKASLKKFRAHDKIEVSLRKMILKKNP